MFGKATYLIWLALCMGAPLLMFWRWRARLWAQRRALAWTTGGALAGGWAWDALSLHWGIWFYAPEHISGAWLLGLPLEEWLWIVGIAWLFGALTVILHERDGGL